MAKWQEYYEQMSPEARARYDALYESTLKDFTDDSSFNAFKNAINDFSYNTAPEIAKSVGTGIERGLIFAALVAVAILLFKSR